MSNPFDKPRMPAPSATALASSAAAQATAISITEKRVLSWHSGFVERLRERFPDMPKEEADAHGMNAFEQICGYRTYLEWPLADTAANNYVITD